MDTFCLTCGEPWSTYHMRHDEIHETDLPDEVKDSFTGTSSDLTPEVRKAFHGWEFGSNVLVIKKCPACPKEISDKQKEIAQRHIETMDSLADVLGDDLDGFVSTAEDYFGSERE